MLVGPTTVKMGIYRGVYRQKGGWSFSPGLGGILNVLSRTLTPTLKSAAGSLIKNQAKRLGPKLMSAGLGVLSDVQNKKNFKAAVKSRGKRLLDEALNIGPPRKKRHTAARPRGSKSRPKRHVKRSRTHRKRRPNKTHRRDIFN